MKSREKAVLAALRLPSQPRVVVEESLDELGRLAESAGAMVVGRATQDRRAPTPGLYFGTSTGQVFASADEGDSWAEIASYLPAIASVEVAQVA